MKQLHLIGLTINSALKVAEEVKDGIKYFVIRGARVIANDLAMNRVLYPRQIIAEAGIPDDGIPMPIDHPQDEQGRYIGARMAQALQKYWAGAIGMNWREEDGAWLVDMWINQSQAAAHPKGEMVLAWCRNAMNGLTPDPMHLSTGWWAESFDSSGMDRLGREYDRIVRWMQLDHVAILPDSTGAATPAEGVGMWPNAENGAELQVNALHVSYDLQNSCQHDKTAPSVNQEESPMKDLMLKALAAAGVLTVNSASTDEQVLAAYTAHMTTKAHGDLTAQVNSLQAKVTAYEVEKAAALKAEAKTKADALVANAKSAGVELTLNSDALAEMALRDPSGFAQIEALAKPTKKDPDPLVNQANLGGGAPDTRSDFEKSGDYKPAY